MIFDKQNLFSNRQAVTATAVSTDVVDLGAGDSGNAPYLSVIAAGYSGAGSIVVELQTSNDAAFGAVKTLATFPVSNADLKKGGAVVAVKLPKGMQRFARLNYAVTGAVSGGAILAGLVMNV